MVFENKTKKLHYMVGFSWKTESYGFKEITSQIKVVL